MLTPPNVKPAAHKWVFIRKSNEKNEVLRYKARLVAQVFSQCLGIHFEEMYSPVMGIITFCYLVSLVVFEKLDIQLMDVVTVYLSGNLGLEIYMKVLDELQLPKSSDSKPWSAFSIRLKCSLF
jgi:hypothetical protein